MKYILLLSLVAGALLFYRAEARITNLEFQVQVLSRDSLRLKTNEALILSSQKREVHKQREQGELLSAVAKAVVALLDQASGAGPNNTASR